METLFDKIDVKPARRYVSAHHVVARILAFFSELSPRTLAWSAGAASLIILLQLGLLGGVVFTQQSGGSYQTASAPAAMPARGAFVLIQFVPQASAGEITKFLQSNNASIVGGPFTGGFYRVRVAASALPKEQLDELVKRMQQEKSIGFVLPGK
jgi:hypothetical protein